MEKSVAQLKSSIANRTKVLWTAAQRKAAGEKMAAEARSTINSARLMDDAMLEFSASPSRRTAMAACPRYFLSRLRDLRTRTPGDLSVEDVESELKRIEAAKMSKARAGCARQNLRDRIIYALTEAEHI